MLCVHSLEEIRIVQVVFVLSHHIVRVRAQHESIRGSPVLEPVGLVNMWGRHLDPNGFRLRITWPADDYLQVTCVYLRMPKPPQRPYAPARK